VFAGVSGAMTGFRSRLDDDDQDETVPDSAQPHPPAGEPSSQTQADPVTGGGPQYEDYDIDDHLDAEADAYTGRFYARNWDDE
jgi:hypothetical protein